jgi:hypothetical protein
VRRVVSTLLLIVGGWWLAGEMAVAFLDLERGIADNLMMVGVVALFAAVPLALGTWASPGNRRQELGLTMLLATGATLFLLASVAATVMDRAFMRYMPAMPELEFAPVAGVVNLLVVGAAGWWLYRGEA